MSNNTTPPGGLPIADYLLNELERIEIVAFEARQEARQISATLVATVNELARNLRLLDQRLEKEAGKVAKVTNLAASLDTTLRAELTEVRKAAIASVTAVEKLAGQKTVEVRHVIRDANGSIASVVTTAPGAKA